VSEGLYSSNGQTLPPLFPVRRAAVIAPEGVVFFRRNGGDEPSDLVGATQFAGVVTPFVHVADVYLLILRGAVCTRESIGSMGEGLVPAPELDAGLSALPAGVAGQRFAGVVVDGLTRVDDGVGHDILRCPRNDDSIILYQIDGKNVN